MFYCFHNPPNSDLVHVIFNVRTDVNTCDCTWGCTDTVRAVSYTHLTLPTQVRFPGAARFFFYPTVNLQCRLFYGVRTPPCAIACIYICAHVKDPVVYVRDRWIVETLKHPACTVGWVARLCCSWLSPGKATRISHGRNPIGTIQL